MFLRKCSVKLFVRNGLNRLASDRQVYGSLGLGLILRLVALGVVGSLPLRNEAPGYFRMALQLLHHESFSPYWPPGVPYLLLGFQKLFGESILVARATMLPVYVGFSMALYLMVKEVSTRGAANLAVLIFAVYPPYVRFSLNPSTEYPAAACLMAIVYLGVVNARRPSFVRAAALGFFLGALALIRSSSLLLVVLGPLYLLLKTRRIRMTLVTLGVSLILIGSWEWKACTMTGRFVMINESSWEDFYFGNNPLTPLYRTWPEGLAEVGFPDELKKTLREVRSRLPEEREPWYRAMALRYIASRPDLFLLRTFNRFRAYFGFPIHVGEPVIQRFHVSQARSLIGLGLTLLDACFYWPIMTLAILFLFNFPNSILKTDYLVAMLGTALLYAMPYWVSMSQPRYNFPVVPLFAVLAVLFIDSWVERSRAEVFEPLLHSVKRKRALLFVLAFFVYIQIEWLLVGYRIIR